MELFIIDYRITKWPTNIITDAFNSAWKNKLFSAQKVSSIVVNLGAEITSLNMQVHLVWLTFILAYIYTCIWIPVHTNVGMRYPLYKDFA